MNEAVYEFQFSEIAPQRLDKYLSGCLPEFSRTRLQDMIRDGLAAVNGTIATKAGMMLSGGELVQLRVPPTAPSNLQAEDIALDIVFENNDLMVVNKPAGMVVHPSAGHFSGTLVHAALGHAPEMEGIGGEQRPGVVHRLDKNTSGLILMAKNDQAHHWLQDQFRLHRVSKVYLALVDGHPPTPTGRIEAPIGRDPHLRKQMAIVTIQKGREAISEYRTLETFPMHTLLEMRPITGRTHQIRLHLAFLGCPVVGDTVYGHKRSTAPLDRHFLHAAKLTVRLPGENDTRTFEAPLPPELQSILDNLRKA